MHVVPKMDITYNLREEENKEDASNVMTSSGTVRKSNRTKIHHQLNVAIFMVNLKQNNNNFNENFIQFTANCNHIQKKFYKYSARNNNLRFIDNDNNKVLRIYHQNICGLGSKTNDLRVLLHPNLPHILCLTEHHLRQFQIQHVAMDDYILGAEFSRRTFHKGGVCMFIQKCYPYSVINIEKFC